MALVLGGYEGPQMYIIILHRYKSVSDQLKIRHMPTGQNFMYPQTAYSEEINIMHPAAACPHGVPHRKYTKSCRPSPFYYKKWQTKSHESASTFRTRKKSQIPSDLLEIDSHQFAELAALFRDDDFKTVAQAGPLDMSKKLIRI